jgi:hypothetical protein
MNNLRRFMCGVVFVCLGLSTAWAGSTLHVGPGAGSKCATGCAGDPNLLAGAHNVDIYQTSGGAVTLSQPVLVIFGVPSNFDHLFPTNPIKLVKAINAYPDGVQTNGSANFAAGGTYGLKDPVSDGFFGTMMAGQEVYGFLGLAGANNSNSFTNWFDADEEYLDLKPTGFNIHVFAISADLGPEGLINLTLAHNVPKGTYIVAYGMADGKPYSVPFTEAGLKCTY